MPGTKHDPSIQAALAAVVADNLPAMLAYWDKDLRCRFANRAYELWFGVTADSMIGRYMPEFLGPLYALNRPYVEAVLRGEPQEFERDIPDPKGGPVRHSQAHYIPDVRDGVVRGFSVLVVDITRRKQAEGAVRDMQHQLAASERLTALATLAAGIAHEINNPLAAILTNVALAIDGLAGTNVPAATWGALADAAEAGKRAARIVSSLKLLARGEASPRQLVDVDAVLRQSLELTANVTRYRARLVEDLRAAGQVEARSGELVQVFVNLLANAAQALPEDRAGGNEIRVTSHRDDGRIVVEIADNGVGIPGEVQPRIFDPFFTTKDVGAGMGLGLSISRTIVQALGGDLTVRSAPGEGSVFTVILPLHDARDARTRRPPSEPPRAAPDAPTAAAVRRRVFVIDDDERVARSLLRVLEDVHDVDVETSAPAALERLVDPAYDVDVIVCDLMMPVLTGADLYDRVAQQRPALAAHFVFVTGGAFTPRGQEFLARVAAPVVEKPFDIDRLRAVVAEVGGRPRGA